MLESSEISTEILLSDAFGVATCTSRQVSTRFGKRHGDVLVAIRSLISEMPDLYNPDALAAQDSIRHERELSFMYFDGTEEVVVGNGGIRKDSIFHMTKDGFAFIAMGFTGSKANIYKRQYIKAFNTITEKLLLTQEKLRETTLSALHSVRECKADIKRLAGQIEDSAVELIALKTSTSFVADPLPPPSRTDFLNAKWQYDMANGAQVKRVCERVEKSELDLKTLLASLPKEKVQEKLAPPPLSSTYDDGSDDIRF